MFAHEKLQVYAKALAFVAAASGFSAGWDRRHAVVDHLGRASDSIILNLAQAARFRSGQSKLRTLDYSIGSSLECAGCLDIARIKGLLAGPDTDGEKRRLAELTRMLFGLRKAWETWRAHEDSPSYRAEPSDHSRRPLFHHETLDVYNLALRLAAWFVSLPGGSDVSCRLYRQIDEAVTSVILNIAEGNGRYSELDHRRFLDLAEGSTVKVAAYLDLMVHKRTLCEADSAPGKALLERIAAMLSRM
jgi:four helix bundle protein